MERIVKAVHGAAAAAPEDPAVERELTAWMKEKMTPAERQAEYGRYAQATDALGAMMRRCLLRSLVKSCGPKLTVEVGVHFKHPETFEFGHSCFLGAGSFLQGRFDGTFRLGDVVWIGPQCYFDARDLVIEDYVGVGPSVRILGSEHTGVPVDVPAVKTDLVIKPVRLGRESDIGMNASILPGVTVGQGAFIGAGAVVTKDVADYDIVAGVPARVIRNRKG